MLRKTLWISFCMIFVPVILAQAYTDPANIVGVWLFDEGSGDNAADSSEHGHDGRSRTPHGLMVSSAAGFCSIAMEKLE